MKIVVPVKYVPEPTARWHLADDLTLDRESIEGRLSQLDEHAVEQAVRLVESGLDAEITFLTMGPARAVDGLRQALAMGGDRGVHILDGALHGSDALTTSLVLAAAIRQVGFDLVICGMASTDAEMSVVPAMLAERLGVPEAALAVALAVEAGTVTIHRDTDAATEEVVAGLPAVVSVTDQSGEPRYTPFKAIMAGRRKPVRTLSLTDLGLPADTVGWPGAAVYVTGAMARPPRQAGTVITDSGNAAAQLAEWLVARQLA